MCLKVLKPTKKPINKPFGSEIPTPKINTIYLLKMPGSAVAQTCNLSTQETESGALQQAYGCPRWHSVSGQPGLKTKQSKQKTKHTTKNATHKWYSTGHFNLVK